MFRGVERDSNGRWMTRELDTPMDRILTERAYSDRAVPPAYWMRSVQFAGLHRILHRIAGFRQGIRVKDLNALIAEERDYLTERGEPSKTTLYHCRNTLIQIGALEYSGQKLVVARENPAVKTLLDVSLVRLKGRFLPAPARDAFASLVLANDECYSDFFRLFFSKHPNPTLDEFKKLAGSVIWRPIYNKDKVSYELRSELTGERITLVTPIQIRSILYGVRDWAGKQLRLTDEFYDISRNGSVIFPLRHSEEEGLSTAVAAIMAAPQDDSEWTMVSIRDLQRTFCERDGNSVASLFSGIKQFVRENAGYVSLIPTIPNFVTITASSRKGADYQLRSAFKDSRGRFISHLRFHKTIREHPNGEEKAKPRI